MVRTRRLNAWTAVVAASLISCTGPLPDSVVASVEHKTDALWSIKRWKIEGGQAALIDVRRQEDFKAGHLPGAHQIWRTDMESKAFPYAGMAASKEVMLHLLDSLGIETGQQVVVYDGAGGCNAARLWWLLNLYGHAPVALLDGGPQAWQALGNALEVGQVEAPTPTGFQFCCKPKSNLLATQEDVKNAASNGTLILDTRTDDEYSGRRMKNGATRAGRIPGSLQFNWGNAVNLNDLGTIKSTQDLTWDFQEAGIDFTQPIITYCHTGVRSAHTTFVLRNVLGFNQVSNYDGSWSEWSFSEELPLEADEPVNPEL